MNSTRRMRRILDEKYEKADLNKVMTKQCQHLTATERHRLLHLLNKFEGFLTERWVRGKTTPVGLEIKDNVNPVCL